MSEYYAVYKPYDYLSQFTAEVPGQKTLKDLYDFPGDVYPVGRLDRNSEGLLVLSNDKSLTADLLNPTSEKYKTYLVQVEGKPSPSDIKPLTRGLKLRIKKRVILTKPARVHIIQDPQVQDRNPPIRERKNVPDSWLKLSITEGKYHQVRKMCAAIGYPVLRLIRVQIGNYKMPSMEIGTVWKIENRKDII